MRQDMPDHAGGRLTPGCLAAIGVFDGVHLGHQAILKSMVAEGNAGNLATAAVTFEPHPLEILCPERSPGRLMSPARRVRRIRDLGVRNIVILRFDRRLADLTAEEFVSCHLLAGGAPRRVYVGFNFTFGRSGAGTADTLTELGARYGFEVEVVPPVKVGDMTVSSTLIRDLVAAGRVQEAGRLLGMPYRLSGTVGKGDGLGRRLGFPTANVTPDARLVIPGAGVYAARVAIAGKERPEEYAAVINVGVRPTVGGGTLRVEAHLFGYEGSLYGRPLEISFAARLRAEREFADVETLSRQIAADAVRAKAVLKGRPTGDEDPGLGDRPHPASLETR